MRQTTRQKHLKQHHKTTNTRRKNYFHAAQQELQSPLAPTPGFSTLTNMMQKLRPLKAKMPSKLD
ncbi:hypothetical protein L2744_02465 [Shewanella profunda]|uniref:hypothetical protein n=1 Tax=Shewanella profunda TaxID=254793 RepID=UPI00200F9494|nr:hypothetical protein [Shewanella profunda]MCL1088492.1 hypothetical protein [Shewanella profunda]